MKSSSICVGLLAAVMSMGAMAQSIVDAANTFVGTVIGTSGGLTVASRPWNGKNIKFMTSASKLYGTRVSYWDSQNCQGQAYMPFYAGLYIDTAVDPWTTIWIAAQEQAYNYRVVSTLSTAGVCTNITPRYVSGTRMIPYLPWNQYLIPPFRVVP